eukprot:TCONS_00059975-protein
MAEMRSVSTIGQNENDGLKTENEKLKKKLEEQNKEILLLRAAIESLKGTTSFVLMELRLREGIDKFIVKDKHITNLYSSYESWLTDIVERMDKNWNYETRTGTEENEKYFYFQTARMGVKEIRPNCSLLIEKTFESKTISKEETSYSFGKFTINQKSESWLCDRAIAKTIFLLHPTDHSKSVELQPDDAYVKGLSLSWQAEGINSENAIERKNGEHVRYIFLMCILRKYY